MEISIQHSISCYRNSGSMRRKHAARLDDTRMSWTLRTSDNAYQPAKMIYNSSTLSHNPRWIRWT